MTPAAARAAARLNNTVPPSLLEACQVENILFLSSLYWIITFLCFVYISLVQHSFLQKDPES